MRLPILYTMSWPERVPCSEATWPRLDFTKCSQLTFKAPDREKYPAMDLAYAAGRCARPCRFRGLEAGQLFLTGGASDSVDKMSLFARRPPATK